MDADNFPSSCCGRSCSRLSFNFGGPWDGRERAGGEGRMGGLGSGEWMPTTFHTVVADAAVLVYLLILNAPGMGGRGQGRGKDVWVGIWGVNADNFPRSCCRRSCSRLSFDFGGPWDGWERGGEAQDGRVGIW